MSKFTLSLVALAVSTSSMAVETQTDDIERMAAIIKSAAPQRQEDPGIVQTQGRHS